jgi:ribokinase
MSARIVTIGSSNVDLIMKMAHLPKVGETVPDAVFMQTFGGKGANQAYAAAQAGGAVTFVSCVGDDSYGPQVIDNMRAGGCDVSHVSIVPGSATGLALIMIGEAGQNMISVAPGANYRLSTAHIDAATAAIAAADLVLTQYEMTPEVLAFTLMRSAELGKPVVFNLAPARAFDEALLKQIAYLIVNETEAAFLCGFDVDSEANVRRAAAALLEKGARAVILTLGAQGAYVQQRGEAGFMVPSFEVDAVDTTAAGDTFCGALAVVLLEGRPLRAAVQFANAAAAMSVTRMGAQASAPTRAQIDGFLKVRALISGAGA